MGRKMKLYIPDWFADERLIKRYLRGISRLEEKAEEGEST